MIPRIAQMRFPGCPGRKFAGFLCLGLAEAAVFVGVGHWLHDTPPIFQIGQCMSSGFVPVSEAGRFRRFDTTRPGFQFPGSS
jgi:hypothetical protein